MIHTFSYLARIIVSLVMNTGIVTTLHSLPFFKTLDVGSLESLSKYIKVKKVANETVMEEGMSDGLLYIVSSGQLYVYKKHKDEEVQLITLTAGAFVGLGSLLEGTSHSASVKAKEETELFVLAHADFRTIIAEHPMVAESMMQYLSSELRRFRSRLVGFGVAENEKTKIVFFDCKQYDRTFFDQELTHYPNVELKYFDVKLSTDTAFLATGATVVCIFVNDKADAEVVTLLYKMGVKMIALRCAGFNNVDLKVCDTLGITVARVPVYSPYAVAEHALALIMGLNRKLHVAYNRIKQGNFSLNNLVGFDIHGTTVGVIGTGKIGQCFIKIMLGFGCQVLCYDAYPSEDVKTWANCKYVTLDELYAQSRIISIHCPLLPSTQHMINKEAIDKMKPGVLIINTSRGPIIKTIDLIAGLKSKKIGGAGLDVYEDERDYFFEDRSFEVIKDDTLARLMTFNNVFITSHQAFLTEDALKSIASVTMNNIHDFLSGKTMKEVSNSLNQ
jgi:D-lactate dehydrogenase